MIIRRTGTACRATKPIARPTESLSLSDVHDTFLRFPPSGSPRARQYQARTVEDRLVWSGDIHAQRSEALVKCARYMEHNVRQGASELPLFGAYLPPAWLPCDVPVDPFVSARLVAKREGRPVGVVRSPAQTAERKAYVATINQLTASLARCATHEARRNLRHALADARAKVARVA